VELFAKVVDTPEELVAFGIELFSDVEVPSVVADGVDALFVQLTNRAASRPKIVMAIIIFFFMFFLTFKPRFSPPQTGSFIPGSNLITLVLTTGRHAIRLLPFS
jgi:hypothetical protein